MLLPKNSVPFEGLYSSSIVSFLMCHRWYEHVSPGTSYINLVMCMDVPGRRMPKKTWSECVGADMRECSLGGYDPQNREDWRFGVEN